MSSEIQPVAARSAQSADGKLQLESVLPDWCALSARHLLIGTAWCLLFLLLCYLPVSSLETWRCVNEGEFVSAEARLKQLPLSSGVRFMPIGVGGKQLIASLFQAGGAESLGLSFAVLQLLSFCLWTALLFKVLRSDWALLAGVGIAIASFFELNGLSTIVFGQLLGAVLIWMLFASHGRSGKYFQWNRVSSGYWFAVFVLMVAWTNLDVTFIFGMAILLCFAIARIFELKCESKVTVSLIVKDPEFRSRLWLFEFAALATLFTPAGLSLWKSAFWWPDNPVLDVLSLNQPTYLASWSGIVVVAGWGGWMKVALASKKEPSGIAPFCLLLALTATAAVSFNQQFTFWFAAAIAVSICEMLSRGNSAVGEANQQRICFNSPGQSSGSLKFIFSMLLTLVIWMTFCFSPFGSMLLGGTVRTQQDVHGQNLPMSAKQFLCQQETALVHCPTYWSDWIGAGSQLPLMASSNFSAVPRMVNRDHRAIATGTATWRKTAEKYPVSMLLIDKRSQKQLVRSLRRSPGQWRLVFEDSLCLIYQRVS